VILHKRAIAAIHAHRKRQAAERLTAGEDWHDNNLVFSGIGTSAIAER
jgi:hypothetical protein